MSFTRAIRSFIGRLMVGVMLLSQFAVAAYACPTTAGTLSVDRANVIVATHHGSQAAPCEQGDSAQKSLCIEHCHPSSQSADTATPPAPATAMAMVLYVLPVAAPIEEASPGVCGTLPAAPSLEAASPPSHAVLHCVLRI